MMAAEKSICHIHCWEGAGSCPDCYPPGSATKPGGITYIKELPDSGIERRPGVKFVTKLPEGESCVGMVVFNDRVIVATTAGVFYLDPDGVLQPIEFALNSEDLCG